jgi:hypothetical protein
MVSSSIIVLAEEGGSVPVWEDLDVLCFGMVDGFCYVAVMVEE